VSKLGDAWVAEARPQNRIVEQEKKRGTIRGSRGLVVVATMFSVLGAVLWLLECCPTGAEVVGHISFVLLTAAPLFLERHPFAFRLASWIACVLLAYVTLAGSYVGLGVYGPSTVLLLAAAVAPSSWRPTARRFVGASVGVVASIAGRWGR
jgi:hypothetical protein